MEIKQYCIVLVNLDRSVGAEIRRTRPCVVVSPDEMNRYLRTIVVVPMTTQSRIYPTRVKVKHKQKAGWLVVDQLRTIHRKRILKVLGALSNPEIRKLKNVIRETYVE